MAEQEQEKPKAAAKPAAKAAEKQERVFMRVDLPHEKFDLSAQGLPSVTNKGEYFTPEQADEVTILALKYGVPVYRVDDEEN